MEKIKDIASAKAVPWETLATAIDDNFSELSKKVESIELQTNAYCVGAWEEGSLSPDSVETYGDPSLLDKWNPYLLDTTDNEGETTTPVGRLKKNNYLRFDDGTFAPTVGITEEMRAECDGVLYLDSLQAIKYCDAGKFDPVAFYEEYGMTQKLYDPLGNEVRILRPWETTETKYTIGIGREDTLYLLDNVTGNSGKCWKGLFTTPVVWDGVDISAYALPPTALSPSPVCTVGNKTRSFFYLSTPDHNNCKSAKGQGDLVTMFYNGRTYPRTTDMQQVNNMNLARANNADPNAPYPFAEGGYHALNTFITCLEVLHGTKYLHAAQKFSSGITCNDGCNSEALWKENGGVRYKLSQETAWKYGTFGTTPDIYYNTTGSKTYFSVLLNQEYPKEQCMESQMAASFAAETGVSEGQEFEFYGATYWYKNVTGVSGLSDGEMNVRIYKKMTETFQAYNASGDPISVDVEVILRMGLYAGMNLSGDIFAYWGGGYEQVGTCVNLQADDPYNNPVDLYLQPDQKKWLRETLFSKASLGVFDFEKEYLYLGRSVNLTDGYALRRKNYTAWKTAIGGGINMGACFYAWTRNYWGTTLDTRYRVAARFRGYAHTSLCSSRAESATIAASAASRYTAGSAQALINVGAAMTQSK